MCPDMPRRLDYRALADYLVLGYPIAPATFFADVRGACHPDVGSNCAAASCGKECLLALAP